MTTESGAKPGNNDVAAFEPARRSARAWATFAVSALIALAIDLWSKYVAFEHVAGAPVAFTREQVLAAGPSRLQTLIPRHEPVVVIPDVLNFQLVLNAGAVFGAGQGRRWFFVLFTLAALGVATFMFARWTDRRQWLSHVCLGLVLAGGLGNLYDRLVYACVRDFLHPLPTAQLPFGLRWPGGDSALWPYVSNVADAFLIVGIGGLLIAMWRADSASRQRAGPASGSDAPGPSAQP
ncbi:MAG: signal peptidase II [Planctomycetota bacterium]|nr:signal peptidase II [Planctomycetota bacterium]